MSSNLITTAAAQPLVFPSPVHVGRVARDRTTKTATKIPMASYKPSVGYFRRALRDADTVEEVRAVGLLAVRELENLKDWVRSTGETPPKRFVLLTEAKDKGLAVRRLPATA